MNTTYQKATMRQVVDELHKPARKNYERRTTILKGIDDLWQVDLAEFQQYSKENNGYRYVFVVICCFSKFVWTRPLKDKTAANATKAMKSIFKEGRIPKNIQTDLGKEFYNDKFKHLMTKHGINHYSTYTITKAAIVERVIRTLKEKIYKQFSLRGEYKWSDILSTIVKDYNNTKHRTINMKPCDVTFQKEKLLLDTVYSKAKVFGKGKFRIGDIVRISKQKALFEKGYTPNWSTELFKIVKIKITNPITYLLEDYQQQAIKGAFYEPELQKVKFTDVYLVEKVLKRKGSKAFVKWLGFDNTHNSWITVDKN